MKCRQSQRHQTQYQNRTRDAKLGTDDLVSTHVKPVNPSVIFIKLAQRRLIIPNTPFRRNMCLGSLHFKTRQHWITKVRFVNRSPQLKALHYWRLCLKGPDNSSNLIEAVLALHATNRSNLKGLLVPFRAIILFKNLANLEKAAKDTDIKPLSFSCRMQVTHQGNSLPLDRYSFSQRKKCTCLAGCTSVMITENLHLSLESLWKSSLIHLQSDQGTA